MIPVITIVGNSGSGKTTLITKLIQELKYTQGFRVATIKHCHKGFEIDKKGKDSWRFTQAGANIVLLSSHTKLAFIKEQKEPKLDDICKLISDVDIILVEGYESENKPMIEVSTTPSLLKRDNLIAIITTNKIDFSPCFYPDDIKGIAKFIKERFLSKTT